MLKLKINAEKLHFSELNKLIRQSEDEKIILTDVLGHRYIGSGTDGKDIEINGVPGNALGAYLNGSTIRVKGGAQDATGDTMNKGAIIIEGSTGDATGYAMRGGKIYVKGNAGYRAGIHMKAYKEHQPVIIIGGKTGDFLGEYQAGGFIIVLGLYDDSLPVGSYCGTGMHGGKIFIRGNHKPDDLPAQIECKKANKDDIAEISCYVKEFFNLFGLNEYNVDENFYVLTPNTKNPYEQLYTYN